MRNKLILLKSEKDFGKFRLKSKLFTNSLMRIRVSFDPGQNFPRFGFIIPKKVAPKAVTRNRIKRRMKALLTKKLGNIIPADFLIFPNPQVASKPFEFIEAEVIKLLKAAKLWK